MTTITRRQVARILTQHVEGVDGYGARRVAEALDVATRTIERWCAAETRPYADELLDLVAAIGEDDPVRVAVLWRDLSALVGQESRPAPRLVPEAEIANACLEVAAEAGDVSAALRRARDPSGPGGPDIVASEAAEIAEELHQAEVAAVCARSTALGLPSPHLPLTGTRS